MSQTHYMTRDFDSAQPYDEQRKNSPGQSFAKFYAGQVLDKKRTEALNRPAYRTVDMVQIIIPGDNTTMVDRRVKPGDQERWPRQWEAYKQMTEYVPEGTLIDNWTRLTRGQVEDLKYNRIYTVEQLAELSDEHLQRLGLGARRMREHARAFLDAAKTGAPAAKLVEENERLKNQISLLTNQMSQLTTQMEVLAKKAGEDSSDIDNPLQQVQLDMERAREVAAKTIVDIPDDYESANLVSLRKICSRITDERVMSKAEAIEIIKEYKEQEGI